mgnify:CR=1 FL=1
MLPQYFVYVAILTSSLAIYSYLKDVVKGKTKPNLASWFIWFLAPMVAAIVGWKNGAGISVLPVFLAGFIPFLVIVFSVFNKDSYWKLKKLETAIQPLFFGLKNHSFNPKKLFLPALPPVDL